MENYESLGVIGEGTYGVVMKARHKETGQVVAIKKFKESDEDEQVRKTSLREVRVLKQLRHDNVITLLEVFRRKGKLYLVFEYVEKTILEVLEKKPQGLDEMDVRKYTYQLLRGVEYCHANNIIHRDVKPENILISKNGALKICDFGFARPMSVGGKYTDYVATRWYRSPELLVGDVEYGKGVDIWAIGCIFAEISNGMPLFAGESDPDQLAHIMRCNGKLTPRQVQIFRRNPLYVGVDLPPVPMELESLDSRFPNAPKNWLNFLKGCLRNDPDQRETCASLIALPYFTDRNFRSEFDAELKMIMEKENRSNLLKRPPAESQVTKTANDEVQQPEVARDQGQPVAYSLPPTKINSQPVSHTGHTPIGQNPPGANPQHSLWSQYLQSTNPQDSHTSSTGHTGQPSANPLFPGLKQSTPVGQVHPMNSFLPQAQTHAQSGQGKSMYGGLSSNNSSSNHPSYLTTYSNSEPLMVTNSVSKNPPSGVGAYGLGAKKTPTALGLGTSGMSSGLSSGNPDRGGTLLPTLTGTGVSQGSSPSTPQGIPGWGLAPTTAPTPSQTSMSGLSSQGATASQLAYKKKPAKRNVLSTLSLTAFGGQQQSGSGVSAYNEPSSSGPSSLGISGGGYMMLHGQSHSLDHPSGPGASRRSSKPWN